MVKAKPEWEKTNIAIIKAILKLGKPAFGDLLKETGLSKPSLTEHLKELLDKKLITAEKSQKDKRKWLYSLNPNELCLITVDEVIKAIKEELKAVGEKLTAEEEQKLKEFFIKYFRKLIIKEYLDMESYKEYTSFLYYILRRFSLIVLNRLIYDSFKEAVIKRDKKIDVDKKFKEFINMFYNNLYSALKAFEGMGIIFEPKEDIVTLKEIAFVSKDYISSELAKKWVKTKFFREFTPFGQSLNMVPVILAMVQLQSDKRFRNLLKSFQK